MRSGLIQSLIVGSFMVSHVAGAWGQTAAAPNAEPASNATDVADVIVTANKRSERLQDVPASVTAISVDTLTAIGASRMQDYIARAPGLVLDDTSFSNGLNQLTIRGLSTGTGGNPTVGVYIDDSPYGGSSNNSSGGTSVPDLDPLDLSRVEVLRGPQGTLYGAGSLGGLFKYVTAAPDPTRFFGRVQTDGSFIDGGGSGFGIRGAANIPLTSDLAVRASGYSRHDPGFIDNVETGAHDVNDARVYGGRLSLGWQPSENWSVRASALLQRQNADGNAVEDHDSVTFAPVSGELEQSRESFTGKTSQSDDFFDLVVRGDLGFATLTSATSYQRQKLDFNLDVTDAFGGLIGIPGAGVAIITDSLTRKVTQEVRLASPDETPLSWQGGVFYTHESNTLLQPIEAFDPANGGPLPFPVPTILDAEVPTTFEEVAAFGDVTYHFTSSFDITGGLRYSRNKQSVDERLSGLLTGDVVQVGDSKDHSTTWMLTPRLHLSPDSMIYGRVATGYRPGGPNLVVPGIPTSYGPDRVINYELGLKTDLLERTLALDLSVYSIFWRDIQLNEVNATGQNFNGNASKARSRGIEASLAWRPVAGLEINGNASYDEATLRADLPPGGQVAFSGDQLPSTPKWSGQVSADYDLPISAEWHALVGADWRWVGDRQSYFTTPPQPRYQLPAYQVGNLRVGVRDSRFTIMAYANNVGDSRGQGAAYSLGPSTRVSVIRPRTFGISASVEF